MFEIDLLRILLSGIAAVVIGMVWYSPKVFGNIWMALIALTPDQQEQGKKTMIRSVALGFASNVVLAYIFTHFAIAWGIFDTVSALQLAFWAWLGFQMPVSLAAVLWEQRPWKWFLISSGYQLVTLMAMGLILVL